MSGDKTRSRVADVIAGWVDFCQARAALVIVVSAVLTVAAVVYLSQNLRINTDNEEMLSSELQFRQLAIAVDKAFPAMEGNMLIVLEAPDRDVADDAMLAFVDALKMDTSTFESVFASNAEPFFRRNGLLYLNPVELEDLQTRLVGAQPFLGTLWQQPNLAGLADMTALLTDAGDTASFDEAAKVLGRIADVVAIVRDGGDARLEWTGLIGGAGDEASDIVRRLIVVKPVLDFGSLAPASRARAAIQGIADDLGLEEAGIRLRLTGSAALEDDELKSVEQGMGLAGLVSLALVTLVLAIGLRSAAMIVSLIATLACGLVWTAALAIFLVGSFNLISVAFAVLFVGLSVDFGIHFALRCCEHADADGGWPKALVAGAGSVGSSLALCTVTTAWAFFSFLPTSYTGLAELGLIAGIGMLVAFSANVTVLPAALRLTVRQPPRFRTSEARARGRAPAPGVVLIAAAAVTLIAAWSATGTRFDFDPMNLRDPDAPSMRTLFDLADDGLVDPYGAEVLSADIESAAALTARLEKLPSVDRAVDIGSFVPADQDRKFEIIDDLGLILGPAFFAPQGTVEMRPDRITTAVAEVRDNLGALADRPLLGDAAGRLRRALADISGAQVGAVNDAVFAGLPGRLDALAEALDAEPVTLETLPASLRSRYVAGDGRARVDIEPAHDLRDLEKLRAFVDEIRTVAPDAIGPPVIIVEAGREVLGAFAEALVIAVVGISLVVWLTLRRVTDVVLIFVPVAAAALWTMAVSANFGMPFNFANVIVLPLLFGLSVDYGIHMVMRARGGGSALATTTPRAILLSALTTVGSFGSIVLSGHPGTASMGALLSVSIGLSVLAILLILPALMQAFIKDDVDR